MDVFTVKIKNKLCYKCFIRLLKNIRNGNKMNISYKYFKSVLAELFRNVMEDYLVRAGLIGDDKVCLYSFKIDSDLKKNAGLYYPFCKRIVISEEVIENLYNGDIAALIVIFHELFHFVVDVDISRMVFDPYLYRILKERLLDYSIDKNEYYDANYKVYSEEIFVEIIAVNEFCSVIMENGIKLKKEDILRMKDFVFELMDNWDKHVRDFTNVDVFNSNYLDFDIAFDVSFKDNKEWLDEYPILSVEYYLDRDGNLVKRDLYELGDLLKRDIPIEIKTFISQIIVSRIKGDSLKKEWQDINRIRRKK